MTEPAPTVDLLVTPAELAEWLPDETTESLSDEFTLKVLWATSVLIRDAGSELWTHENVPQRAKLIAELVAKNYWQHPEGVISETTGPISDRYIDEVVHNMTLTEEQQEILARLADETEPAPSGDFGDLQVLTTTRGPVETGRRGRRQTIYVRDAQGSAIGYYDPVDAYAYTPLSELGF